MFKKISVLILSVVLLGSCNTKFSVNGEYEETPVIHFLLDQGKEYQFMKLNRTFLEEGNAADFAMQPELSYFDNVEATVTEYINNMETRSWTLKDTVIQNKKDGVFYGPEQKLYYFKPQAIDSVVYTNYSSYTYLDDEATYNLEINIDNGTHTILGQTELIDGVNITYPAQNHSMSFAESDVASNGYRSTPITFSKSNDAPICKLQIRFDYKETTASSQEVKSLLWDVGEVDDALSGSNSSTISANGEPFYQFVKDNIAEDQNVIRREVDGFEIILTAGSTDLYTYMLANEPTSSLAQNQPTYSNVDGALGIFSSRYTQTQYKSDFTPPFTRALNQNSTKELANGQYTAALKFCSSIPSDAGLSYGCN